MENNKENNEKKEPILLKGESITISTVVGNFSLTRIKEYYQKNIWLLVIVIIFTILSSIIGLFISGILGALIGLAIGAIAFAISLIAVTKVIEKHTYQSLSCFR